MVINEHNTSEPFDTSWKFQFCFTSTTSANRLNFCFWLDLHKKMYYIYAGGFYLTYSNRGICVFSKSTSPVWCFYSPCEKKKWIVSIILLLKHTNLKWLVMFWACLPQLDMLIIHEEVNLCWRCVCSTVDPLGSQIQVSNEQSG